MEHLLHLPHGFADATTWALVALGLILALAWRMGLPATIMTALNARADAIRAELDEAKRLREEAQELLASYQRRHREAEKEAEAIIEQAKQFADRLAAETRANLSEQLERRSVMAERRIAQAEADAAARVRADAAALAVSAAEKLLAERIDDAAQGRLFDESLEELGRRFS